MSASIVFKSSSEIITSFLQDPFFVVFFLFRLHMYMCDESVGRIHYNEAGAMKTGIIQVQCDGINVRPLTDRPFPF